MRSLWNHRWLFLALLEREVRNRYVGSVGGWLWAIVHPLLLLGIYTMVFRTIFRVEIPQLGEHPFVAFVALALWPWLAFQEGVQRGVQAVQANSALVRKVSFPHELLVYAAVTATFVVQLAGYALVLTILALFAGGLSAMVLLIVPILALLFLLALACALFGSALQVFLRDFDQLLGPLFMVLFYATPVLYPLALLPGWLGDILAFNPLAQFIEPVRALALFGSWTPSGFALASWAATLLLFVLARGFFLRLSPHFEDFV